MKKQFKHIFKICFIFLIMTGWIFSGWPQIFNFPPEIQEARAGTVTYDTATTHVWNPDAGITSVDVECWGGGGAGGGNSTNKDGAGGGGGGAYAKTLGIAIDSDIDYDVIVGAGGTGVSGGDGGNGGESYFHDGTSIKAKGGTGGKAPIGSAGGLAGAGGTGSTGADTNKDGGAGGEGKDDNKGVGGGGGEAGGSTNIGGVGASGANGGAGGGGVNADGGDGGAGGNEGADGSIGFTPGGGGGGSGDYISASIPATGGAGFTGKCILTWTDPPTSTLSTGSDPGAVTIAPGEPETTVNEFKITTNTGTETITHVTVNLSTANGIGTLKITDSSDVEKGSTASPSNGSNEISVSSMSAGTGGTTFKVRVTPKAHGDMPAVPGAEYDITAPVTLWTTGNGYAHDGSDTNPNALTIDNLSANNATLTSGSAGDEQVTLNWTTSDSTDFNTTSGSVIYRWAASSVGSEVPAEGSTATIGAANGTAITACIVSSALSTSLSKIDGSGGSAECTTDALTNDIDYSYRVFQKDLNGNYDAGYTFASSPFTPSATAPTLSFSITNVAVGFGSWPDTNKRWANSAATGAAADPGAGQATQLGASTNSDSGLVITVKSANVGLYKSYGTTHLIDAVGPSSVANATEGCAIYGANASNLTIAAGFAIDGATALTASPQTFASATGTVDTGTVDVKPIAGITSITPAGSYSDTLTFICTGNF